MPDNGYRRPFVIDSKLIFVGSTSPSRKYLVTSLPDHACGDVRCIKTAPHTRSEIDIRHGGIPERNQIRRVRRARPDNLLGLAITLKPPRRH